MVRLVATLTRVSPPGLETEAMETSAAVLPSGLMATAW